MALLIPGYNSMHRLVCVHKTGTEFSIDKNILFVNGDLITIYPEGEEYRIEAKNLEDFCNLNTGDIVEISNVGRCIRRFDISENDATIFMGGTCNSNCVMCPSFDLERQEPPEDKEYLRSFIEMLPEGLPYYVVTGGEPTMQLEMFYEVMGLLSEKLPRAEALLLTNGRSFSSEKLLLRLLEKCPPFLTVAIPIHGSRPEIHDLVTQSDGSFIQTIQGISNLLNKHIAVEIRVVVTQLNKDDVEKIANLICDRFSSVLRVNFISLEVRGNCFVNKDRVYISPKESFEKSRKAIQKLLIKGIDVGLYNYPLCNVDSGYWFLCKRSISPYKVRYPEECESCTMKEKCGGMFATTMNVAKPQVFPIKDR